MPVSGHDKGDVRRVLVAECDENCLQLFELINCALYLQLLDVIIPRVADRGGISHAIHAVTMVLEDVLQLTLVGDPKSQSARWREPCQAAQQ